MPGVSEHYRDLLGDVYSWMLGGFEAGVAANRAFLDRHDLAPAGSGRAVDLGAGCGFQSLPLAESGFDVLAIDLDAGLLDELERHRGNLPVRTVTDDLTNFDTHLSGAVELVVCMTDTLLHLDSAETIAGLLRKVHAALEPGGRFVATFRDLSLPLEGLDRFVPVRSDDSAILTCFLEYEPQHVRVHDLLYRKGEAGWRLTRSWYRKLRLSAESSRRLLEAAGFTAVDMTIENGLVTAVATKAAGGSAAGGAPA